MTTPWGLCTIARTDGQRLACLTIDGDVWPLHALALHSGIPGFPPALTVLEILEHWDSQQSALDNLAIVAGTGAVAAEALAELDVRAPVERPGQIFCTGANYRKHVIDLTVDTGVGPEGLDRDGLYKWAAEMMDKRAAEGEPYAFTKPISAVAGPNDALVLPTNTAQPDWEIELGVVIGREAYCVSADDAMDHVAGYAIVNDISARDLIARTDYKMLGTDWLRSKGQPGFLPFGPVIVPARFVRDPQNLPLRLTVNGRVMQDETTADMIFGIARQIEYISSFARLLPGDVICTGSPAGNGTHYGRFLQPGDVMTAEIAGLGMQRVECVAPNA
ncbi:fumarylacetoacetate hydrolase family protein [Novosphingobium sp. MMS21-SN21R]|uniref:fumarylacetoacetate hydrolase family protein n=1 Tax=Novosphingobium sp. MMS21-SN21R TaxID=2969298 RepID=UPI002883AE73|nr:fumarylacetoacetate hydrolase family protein [Novosphingobium sp. MMS21-SN21R]MDT0510242.1 fumarylacetoacetate hydrolase family protein [Novosphingobium sp. MMS21-SN21R]